MKGKETSAGSTIGVPSWLRGLRIGVVTAVALASPMMQLQSLAWRLWPGAAPPFF